MTMMTCHLSGFGGSYEWGCQRMLQLGIEYLAKNPTFSFKKAYKQFEHIYGIAIAENESAKALDAAIMDDPKLTEGGVTGAMHQCVMNHLAYIHANGQEKWLAELAKVRKPDDFFEFDGTEASCALPKSRTIA